MEATNVTTEWEQSPELGELFKALSAAQGEIENAAKGSVNPFFKAPGKPEGSKYADLAAIRDAVKEPLAKHGLCVIQQPLTRGNAVGVRTVLGHMSGQYMACTATTTPKDQGPQAYGSCVTYLRRYALSAVTGVATEDDDGEKAQGRDRDAKPPGANWGKPKPAPRQHDPADTGEPITPGTLEDLRFKATAKFPKGKAARDWLKSITGTDDAASLSEFEAQKALKALEAAA